MIAWILLLLAGVLEVVWLVALKYSQGFTKFWPSVIVAVTIVGSVWLVSQTTRSIPVGTAYAVWTGIGAAGGAIAGIVLFHESRELLRLASIALIIVGIVGLKLTSTQ